VGTASQSQWRSAFSWTWSLNVSVLKGPSQEESGSELLACMHAQAPATAACSRKRLPQAHAGAAAMRACWAPCQASSARCRCHSTSYAFAPSCTFRSRSIQPPHAPSQEHH
jgi:hypothetical protein